MSKQVIGKKLKLMNVPEANGEVQQLVIDEHGNVKQIEIPNNTIQRDYVHMFRVQDENAPDHFHTFGLTVENIEDLLANPEHYPGVLTTSANGHTHSFKIGYNPETNSIFKYAQEATDPRLEIKLIGTPDVSTPTGYTGEFTTNGKIIVVQNGLITSVSQIID